MHRLTRNVTVDLHITSFRLLSTERLVKLQVISEVLTCVFVVACPLHTDKSLGELTCYHIPVILIFSP